MAAFISIDGLIKLCGAHPEFEWLRQEPDSGKWRVVVSRNGELFTGECTNTEALQEARNSAVWRDHREHLMKLLATRRALEAAFPQFAPRR